MTVFCHSAFVIFLHQVRTDISERFSMLLFSLNNPTAYSALWDPTNSHSACWGMERSDTLNQLWQYKRQHAYMSRAWMFFSWMSLYVFESVYLLPQMWPSKLWFLLKYWTCSLFEKERRKTKGILFLGLLVWHLETGNILSGREEVKYIEQKEDKKKVVCGGGWGGKAFSFSHWAVWSFEKNKLICG